MLNAASFLNPLEYEEMGTYLLVVNSSTKEYRRKLNILLSAKKWKEDVPSPPRFRRSFPSAIYCSKFVSIYGDALGNIETRG